MDYLQLTSMYIHSIAQFSLANKHVHSFINTLFIYMKICDK